MVFETLNPKSFGYLVIRRFTSVPLPTPEGPAKTIGASFGVVAMMSLVVIYSCIVYSSEGTHWNIGDIKLKTDDDLLH